MDQEYKMKMSKEGLRSVYNNEYTKGVSMKEIESKYGIKSAYFYRWFNTLGLPLRSNKENSKRYTYDENFFSSIDCEEKAYWLGFIYADGYITSKAKHCSRKLGIALAKKDIGHIEKFKNSLRATNPISTYMQSGGYSNKTVYSRILLTGDKICDDLINCGVLENKTNIIEPPSNIEDYLIRHFIRGYFDGDGSVWKQTNKKGLNTQYCVSFVGTDSMLMFIMNNLINNNVIDREYPVCKRKDAQTVSNFKFGGNHIVKRFLDYLYIDSHIYLDRKYDIYTELINLLSSRL